MTEVKSEAYKSPVLITDNKYPAFVFMTLKQYEKLKKKAEGNSLENGDKESII